MTSTERLDALEAAEHTRRVDLLKEAAARANWHDPDLAPHAIDPATIQTRQAAAAAVHTYSAQKSYLIQQPLTQQDLERQWGAEILAGLERGGR